MLRIIIDGYNLLHASDFSSREALLKQLTSYQHQKNFPLTIVFDGTHQGTGSGSRRREGGVEIIYSPLTVTADDTIAALLVKEKVRDAVVVTSDRAVQASARRTGNQFVASEVFARKLKAVITSTEDSVPIPPWQEGRMWEDIPRQRKGGRKLSKEARKRASVLKKL